MSFYYPLGLLGLLGIPVIILIYIIKSKYTEQTIPSTYLWELSEQFLKKKKRTSRLAGILSLILQILAVIAASLLIAHPVFLIPDSANDIYFILDGSASMNMQVGGSTRFDKAKEQINSVIDDSLGGSSYTLVFVNDGLTIPVDGVTDKEQAKASVKQLKAGWGAADCSSAVAYAQSYFDTNSSAIFYLVTDKVYNTNINLINVSGGESNYAIYECDPKPSYTATGLCGTGKVISYGSNATLTVEMLVSFDGVTERKVGETSVQAAADEPTDFTVQSEVTGQAASVKLRVTNGDALAEDNVVVLYDEEKAQERKVLVINDAEDGQYLSSAIASAGKAEIVDVVSSKKYLEDGWANNPDIGLYVFNGYAPAELPKNKGIWLVNAFDGNGKGTGLTYRGMQTPRDETGPGSYYTPTYATGENSKEEKKLVSGLVKREVAVREYARYGMPRGKFTSVLKVGGDSLISAGLNENNDREVVFAFSIGKSNLGLLDDFLILVRNLMNYSFPSVIDQTVFNSGEEITVNVIPGCQNVVVTSPSGKSTTLDTFGNASCNFNLTETGTYKIAVKMQNKSEEDIYYAYSCVPEKESRPDGGGAFTLAGERTYDYSDGYYDKLLAFFIIISLLLLADWGVYCYEQYQLR